MTDASVYWEDVDEGQEIPTFQRKTDIMHWNRYAAVNDEFVYIHMDADYAKSIGQPDVFGMGNLRLAYLHNLLRDWIGEWGDIKRLGCQYRALNFREDILTAHGRITRKYIENDNHLVDLDIWVENHKGENTCPGSATVCLPSREEEAVKSGSR
jgi:acyl dehydratase